jgi:hypothetical protein
LAAHTASRSSFQLGESRVGCRVPFTTRTLRCEIKTLPSHVLLLLHRVCQSCCRRLKAHQPPGMQHDHACQCICLAQVPDRCQEQVITSCMRRIDVTVMQHTNRICLAVGTRRKPARCRCGPASQYCRVESLQPCSHKRPTIQFRLLNSARITDATARSTA